MKFEIQILMKFRNFIINLNFGVKVKLKFLLFNSLKMKLKSRTILDLQIY